MLVITGGPRAGTRRRIKMNSPLPGALAVAGLFAVVG
jgi:hypothetical protein